MWLILYTVHRPQEYTVMTGECRVWASGVQWTRTIGPHQTAPKTHTCTVIKTAEQVRQERQKEQLMKVAQMIYDGVKSGSYSVENVAEAIIYLR